MTSPPESRADRTADALLAFVLSHDMAGYAGLWAPDGAMEFPFATADSPARLDGRAAVADYVAGYNDVVLPRKIVSDRRHSTGDPDTVVVEFTVAGDVVATGEPYELSYVAVISVGDEGIRLYRDYWSPDAVREVMGRLDLAGER